MDMSDMKALIVEDTPDIAANISKILRDAGWSTDIVIDAPTASVRAKDPSLSLIVMDRMLPGADGLDLVETLRSHGVETPVLMLTALGRSENKVEGYERGADDYLAKPFEPAELVARAAALLRRSKGQVRTDLKVFEDLELHVKARRAHRANTHLALSPKEFDLLNFFMDHAGAIVTRDMLLRHVWNLSFDPGTNVIDVNVGRLRRKLDSVGDGPILKTIRGIGYRLGTDELDEGDTNRDEHQST